MRDRAGYLRAKVVWFALASVHSTSYIPLSLNSYDSIPAGSQMLEMQTFLVISVFLFVHLHDPLSIADIVSCRNG
jgi:hypothetical protein